MPTQLRGPDGRFTSRYDINNRGGEMVHRNGTLYLRNGNGWAEAIDRWGYRAYTTFVPPANEWYMYPSDEGYEQCNECSRWLEGSDVYWSDYDQCAYCRRHYNEVEARREDYDDDYYDDEDYGGRYIGVETVHCEQCHAAGQLTHHNPITEVVACTPCGERFGMELIEAVAA